MANVIPTMTELPASYQAFKAWKVVWAAMANGDVGVGQGGLTGVDLAEFTDRSVQVEGTFGAGGNAEVQGSNDGTNFRALRDPSSTVLDITSASVHGILEATALIRPKITAGDGTTSLTVTMFFRRTW